MKEFLDASFRNHPCIAPVITLHLFRSRVTKASFTKSVKCLEGRITALEKNATNLKGGNGKLNGQTQNQNQGGKKVEGGDKSDKK